MKEAGTSVRALRVLLVLAVLLVFVPAVFSQNIIDRTLGRLGVDKNKFDVGKIYDNYQPFLDFIAYAILFIGVSTMGLKKTFGDSVTVPVIIGLILAVAAAFYASTIKFRLGVELGPTALIIGVGLVGFLVFNVFRGMNVDGFHSAAWGIVIAGAIAMPIAEKAMAGLPQDSLLRSLFDWMYIALVIAAVLLVFQMLRWAFGLLGGGAATAAATPTTGTSATAPSSSYLSSTLGGMGAPPGHGGGPTPGGGGGGVSVGGASFNAFSNAQKDAENSAKSMYEWLVKYTHNKDFANVKNEIGLAIAAPTAQMKAGYYKKASGHASKAIASLGKANGNRKYLGKHLSLMNSALNTAFTTPGRAAQVASILQNINLRLQAFDSNTGNLASQFAGIKSNPASITNAAGLTPTTATLASVMNHAQNIWNDLMSIGAILRAGP